VINPAALLRFLSWCLVWLIPLLVPAAYAMRLLMNGPAPSQDAGWSCLALPADFVASGNPLKGWKQLQQWDVAPPPPQIEEDPEALQPEPERAAPPLPFELHGQVGHGDSILYCFFDTNNKTWFRLSPGGVEPSRGLALKATPEDELRLVDLSDGRRYAIVPGRKRPELINEDN
jgi:hypothetical protein